MEELLEKYSRKYGRESLEYYNWINYVEYEDEEYVSALMVAASEDGSFELVELLLKYGADPNIWMPETYTALMRASQDGDLESVQELLSYGADPNLMCVMGAAAYETPVDMSKGFNALYVAKSNDIMEELLYAGSKIDTKTRKNKKKMKIIKGSIQGMINMMNDNTNKYDKILNKNYVTRMLRQLEYEPVNEGVKKQVKKFVNKYIKERCLQDDDWCQELLSSRLFSKKKKRTAW